MKAEIRFILLINIKSMVYHDYSKKPEDTVTLNSSSQQFDITFQILITVLNKEKKN